jgi:arginine decarboxylase
MLQSSSPSAPLLISLAASLDEMSRHGERHWGRVLSLADSARTALAADEKLVAYGPDIVGTPGIAGIDPAKLVVDTGRINLTGYAADRWLIAHRRIHAESADLRRLVFSLTMADTPGSVETLVAGLAALSEQAAAPRPETPMVSCWPVTQPEIVLTPRAGAEAHSVALPIAEAVGRVAGEMIVPYPPGVPLLVPGEVVSAEVVEAMHALLNAGCRIVGTAGADLTTLRCVAQGVLASATSSAVNSTPAA